MRWLAQEFPHLVEGYRALYATKYAPSPYRKEVAHVVSVLRNKYGVNGREDDAKEDSARDPTLKAQNGDDSELPPDQPIFEF
jgi:hypothetical protein